MKTALSIKELQRELGLGKNKAYELTKMPGFPSIKIGKKIIIPRASLERWLRENEGKVLSGQE